METRGPRLCGLQCGWNPFVQYILHMGGAATFGHHQLLHLLHTQACCGAVM